MKLSNKNKIDFIIFSLLTDDGSNIALNFETNEEAITSMSEVIIGLEKLLFTLEIEVEKLNINKSNSIS